MADSFRRFRMTRVSWARASMSGSPIIATASASKSRKASQVEGHLASTTRHDISDWNTALLMTSR